MSTTLRTALARAVAAEREREGITQAELGARLNWSRKTISDIETAKRAIPAHELDAVCKALNCGLVDLLSRVSAADRRRLRL
jgi:transcriptional regulator with XRE-family HTH domain